jgi:hypothetical protein
MSTLILLLGLVAVVVIVVVVVVVLIVQSRSKPKIGQAPGQQAAGGPGWYPDPNYPNLMRYFDGRAWTSATQPRQ